MAEVREGRAEMDIRATHHFNKGVMVYEVSGSYGQGTITNDDGLNAIRLKDKKTGEFLRGESGLSKFRSTEPTKLHYDVDWEEPAGVVFAAYVNQANNLNKFPHPRRGRGHKNWWNK